MPLSITQKPVLSLETIDKLLPRTEFTVESLENMYPKRDLPEGAKVTRIAPSPTGSMHIGTIYTALISERIAHRSNGIFYLRIEDTDKKREVAGAQQLIISSLQAFGIACDEGVSLDGSDIGLYGPYIQSKRSEIYKTYVRYMLEQGMAYPCFMTPEELEAMHETQTAKKIRPGYYGEWAAWRDRSESDVADALTEGREYVIRFRSLGDISQKVIVHDLVRGKRELPQSDNDIVILKRDGLPTYHLAHIVDDYLMQTTTVIRGDEWLSSLPLHVQLTQALDLPPFEYAHVAPIQKIADNSRRKLSKRKDPEATVTYYFEQGYPTEAVIEYLLNQANSKFEDWRRANPEVDYHDFSFMAQNLPKNGGALLNLEKLDDVSQRYLGGLSTDALYTQILGWTETYDPAFADLMRTESDYAHAVFSVERGKKNVRKDLVKLSQAKDVYAFFFDSLFAISPQDMLQNEPLSSVDKADIRVIITDFLSRYSPEDSSQVWFDKVREIATAHGFCSDMKEYRNNPSAYKGSVADVAMVLRMAVTGRNRSPDLYEVMQIMGVERVRERLMKLHSATV